MTASDDDLSVSFYKGDAVWRFGKTSGGMGGISGSMG